MVGKVGEWGDIAVAGAGSMPKASSWRRPTVLPKRMATRGVNTELMTQPIKGWVAKADMTDYLKTLGLSNRFRYYKKIK